MTFQLAERGILFHVYGHMMEEPLFCNYKKILRLSVDDPPALCPPCQFFAR